MAPPEHGISLSLGSIFFEVTTFRERTVDTFPKHVILFIKLHVGSLKMPKSSSLSVAKVSKLSRLDLVRLVSEKYDYCNLSPTNLLGLRGVG